MNIVLEVLGDWPWPSPTSSWGGFSWPPSLTSEPTATQPTKRPDLPPRGRPLWEPHPQPTDSNPWLIDEEVEVDEQQVPSYDAVATPAAFDPDAGPLSRRLVQHQGLKFAVKRSSSRGRPPVRTPHPALLRRHVAALLRAGIIEPARRGAYISYPFLVPKPDGATRFIVDFSHLTPNVLGPTSVHLPLFSNVLRAALVPRGLEAFRIDLRHAFYSVPLSQIPPPYELSSR